MKHMYCERLPDGAIYCDMNLAEDGITTVDWRAEARKKEELTLRLEFRRPRLRDDV